MKINYIFICDKCKKKSKPLVAYYRLPEDCVFVHEKCMEEGSEITMKLEKIGNIVKKEIF